MLIIDFLSASAVAWLTVAGLLGLLVGSFLNVVIYRLPLMLQRDWQQQCAELNGQTLDPVATTPLTLSRPRSRCPHCNHLIRAIGNIPVISFLWLKGRCQDCQHPISLRYPLIELLSAGLSVVVAWQFGLSWAGLGALLLTWILIALVFIDIDHQLLPDNLTLPLLWLGLLFNLFDTFTSLNHAVIGAISGYLVLWSVFQLFRLITGKEGMGYGDFKLLAALGAWLGWVYLPMIVLLSSLVGAIIGIGLLCLKRYQRDTAIPFGPYLAIAGWAALLFGAEINQFYLRLSGLG